MSELEIVRKAYERERAARKEAEALLEEKSRALFEKNQELGALNARLEQLVEARTAELAQARDQAVEASRTKSQFLANMSHELRTPLNAIIGYSELMLEEAADRGDEVSTPDLRRIHGAGKHLLALINDILDLSKIEAGQMTVHLERVALAPLLRTALDTVAPTAEKAGIALELDLDPRLGEVHTDAMRLGQVVLNLLSNAVKFTSKGSVTLSARGDGDTVVLEVRDTGIGIAPDVLPQLFAAFRQADGTTARRYGGTGLGLAISRHFARMLGGDISAESTLGVGSVFRVRIATSGQSLRPRSRPASAAPGAIKTQVDVLVIDDDATARDLLARVLGGVGYSVRVASTAVEGLALARAQQPSLIVLDILMPQVDGWQVLALLRDDPTLADVPVLVASVVDGRAPCLALGAAAFVPKPLDRDRILSAARRLALPPALALVVDDDDDSRTILRRALADAGYRVAEANGGREALARMRSSPPDMVLLDLMMPDGDGFEVIEAMQASEALRAVPVAVVTACQVGEAERQRLAGHARRVFEKGRYSVEELVGYVDRITGGSS